jgi:hypothetical protein
MPLLTAGGVEPLDACRGGASIDDNSCMDVLIDRRAALA